MTGRPWSADEDALFCRFWKAGVPVRRIAVELGRTEGSIRSHRADAGLPARSRPGDKACSIRLILDEPLRKAVDRRARALEISLGAYIRKLISRDVGIFTD